MKSFRCVAYSLFYHRLTGWLGDLNDSEKLRLCLDAAVEPSDVQIMLHAWVSGEVVSCSILVVGGSTAAYSAALVAARANLDMCLVQPTKIVGGQFTTQALPALNDGDLLRHRATTTRVEGERFAISELQRRFWVRQRSPQLVKGKNVANPGGGWVSPLCTTPVVAVIWRLYAFGRMPSLAILS
jgi:hypothetical protein